ncbi:Spy/CpxP family protein refolding chaperone [Sulfurimonas sp.]|uniref:Spy/CpxP family protein refolding chaperone n=1 Tax=Sulfurimonas sp. TaxID=2022749 RepID=UPI003562F926
MRLLIVFLLVISPIFADHDEYDEYERQEYHLPLDVSYLNLNNDQYKQIKHIVKKFKHEHKEFHEESEKIRKKISKLFLSEKFDRDEFVRLSNNLKNLSVEIQADFFVKVHRLLTPKQKKRFVKYMQEWEVE